MSNRATPPSRGRTTRRVTALERDQQRRHAAKASDSPGQAAGRRRYFRGIGHRGRSWTALVAVLIMFGAAGVRLVMIQTVDASALAAKAAAQRDSSITLPASRGTIYDRHGTPIAFTVQGRALAAWPALFRSDSERQTVATIVADALGPDADADEIFTKLTDGQSKYVYLARGLLPAQANALVDQINKTISPDDRSPVTTERQDLRQYPQGDSMRSLLGTTGWNGHGTGGIEIKYDGLLSGTDGSRAVDVDSMGRPIPGTQRDEVAPSNGADVTLTIDADLQYTVTQMLRTTVEDTGSTGGMALIRSATSPDVYAMATYYEGKKPSEVGNTSVTSPFEPGSVVKVVTFGAALEQGLITPTTHYAVPESIVMGGHVIHDAWSHTKVGMTATGILGKSSNVGTLMLAQQIGQDAFADELTKYGLGQKTGIQLPADSDGVVPPQSQWSATSFANLPIGQGLSMTMVQMADMYQGIANGGLRIPPSIVAATTQDDVTTPVAPRTPVRQLSKKSSDTLLDMLRGTVQDGDMMHDGTAPGAALTGYQVAGKTGTAQQVDPSCGCYSQTKVTATFAGIVPADDPVFVITVMLDGPRGGAEGGGVAAPLFKQIAAYALRAFDIPPSPKEAPIYDLYTNMGE